MLFFFGREDKVPEISFMPGTETVLSQMTEGPHVSIGGG